MKRLGRWAVALVLALATCVAAARGAELLFDDPAALAPSAAPALLGPITQSGRTGWDCPPERAARARTASGAELPRE